MSRPDDTAGTGERSVDELAKVVREPLVIAAGYAKPLDVRELSDAIDALDSLVAAVREAEARAAEAEQSLRTVVKEDGVVVTRQRTQLDEAVARAERAERALRVSVGFWTASVDELCDVPSPHADDARIVRAALAAVSGEAPNEWWIVKSEHHLEPNALAYWGPYPSRDAAAASGIADEGSAIVEIPDRGGTER